MVAVNSNVLLDLGIFLIIKSTSSFNALTISSASSKTKYFKSTTLIAPRFIKSTNLPGVATTRCVVLVKLSI